MTFTYNGHNYRMWFEHHSDPGSIRFPKVRYTTCTIVQVVGQYEALEVSDGDAYLSKRDNFCKATGRKLALARALKKLTSDREFRRVAWMAYLTRADKAPPPTATVSITQALPAPRPQLMIAS